MYFNSCNFTKKMNPGNCNDNLFTSPVKSGSTRRPSFAESLENSKIPLLSQVNSQSEYFTHPMADVTFDKLTSLLRIRKFIIQLIISLESTEDFDAIKAKILYDHVISLYKSYMSNDIEIASLVQGEILDTHLKHAEEVHQNVINFQVWLKKILLKESPSLSASSRSNDRSERMKRSDSDDLNSLLNSLASELKLTTDQNEAKKLKLLDTEQMNGSKSNNNSVLTQTVQKDVELPSVQILGLEKSSSIPPIVTFGASPKKAVEQIFNRESEQQKLNELGFEIIQPTLELMELGEGSKEPENAQRDLPNGEIETDKSNDESNTLEAVQQDLSLIESVQPIKSNNASFTIDGILENRPFLQIEPVNKASDKAIAPLETAESQLKLFAEQIQPPKTNDTSSPVQAAQLDELANKTKTLTLNDTISETITNDQANQTKPPENIDEIIDKCFEKQTYLMKKIKLVKLADVNSEDEIEIRTDYLSYLRESFISNQDELEKYLNPFTRKQQQKLSKDVLKTLSDVQFRLEHRKHFG